MQGRCFVTRTGPRRTHRGGALVLLALALGGCGASRAPSLTLGWQQERFVQRSACAEHAYPHRAIAAHLDGLPPAVAQRLQTVTLCANGFCQTVHRDGDRWGYPHLFGEAVHHEQFRVFHSGGTDEASLLFYPPDSWAPSGAPATLTWSSLSTGTPGFPEEGEAQASMPPLVERPPLNLDVWKEPATQQLCAQVAGYAGPGQALLTLQTKPPGARALYEEQEVPVGASGAQACVPLHGSRYAAAFVFVRTDDASVEHKLEIDNPDSPVFACGDGSRRPAPQARP